MRDDDHLWKAIYDLYCLLTDEVNDESAYQDFFERHPIAFSAIGIEHAESFEKRSPHALPFDSDRCFRPEPDFIGVNNSNSRVAVIELKTPFVGDITMSRIDGNRAKFKATTDSYLSQVTEYVESIRGSVDSRAYLEKLFRIQKISDYRIFIVMGVSRDNDPRLVTELLSHRNLPTEIVFYDGLCERMINLCSVAKNSTKSRIGGCFVFYLIFDQEQVYPRAFIAEYGGEYADHISVFVENGKLIVQCLDSENHSHRLESEVKMIGSHYIRFEYSNDEAGLYMSLNVDNVEQDIKIRKSVLRLVPNTSLLTIGANSRGDYGAHFLLLAHYALSRTMDLEEKLGSFREYQGRMQENLVGLEYKPESYMVRIPSGGLVQEREELKPILRVLPARRSQ